MEIKTKYNIGDKVWILFPNATTEMKIIGIRLHNDPNGNLKIEYSFESTLFCVGESEIFSSEEELVDHCSGYAYITSKKCLKQNLKYFYREQKLKNILK